MFRGRLVAELLVAYLAAGISFGIEEYLLSSGAQWSALPPIGFAVLFVALLIRSERAAMFALLATPALLVAEKQFFLVVFMVLPYLFSRNPSI